MRAFAGWPGSSASFLLCSPNGTSTSLDLKILRTRVLPPDPSAPGAFPVPIPACSCLCARVVQLTLSGRLVESARQRCARKGWCQASVVEKRHACQAESFFGLDARSVF